MTKIENFKDSNILVVGDVMLDRYWWGGIDRISPEAPVPIVHIRRTSAAPGGAANVAVNIAALGSTPILIGTCGSDDEFLELKNTLSSLGVGTDGLVAAESRQTTVKTRIVAQQQQVLRIDQEDSSPLNEDESARVCSSISDHIDNADAVVISDYAKGMLTDSVLSFLFETCSARKKPVLVDPKGKNFTKYSGATLLTPNRREAAEACGLSENDTDMVNVAGKMLLGQGNFENILITEGEHGMTLFAEDRTFHIDAAAHQVFDVTGAGDTVIATLGVALASGIDLASAVSLANTAAGISVGLIGAGSVSADLLLREHTRYLEASGK